MPERITEIITDVPFIIEILITATFMPVAVDKECAAENN
jgi:hypothetical protein